MVTVNIDFETCSFAYSVTDEKGPDMNFRNMVEINHFNPVEIECYMREKFPADVYDIEIMFPAVRAAFARGESIAWIENAIENNRLFETCMNGGWIARDGTLYRNDFCGHAQMLYFLGAGDNWEVEKKGWVHVGDQHKLRGPNVFARYKLTLKQRRTLRYKLVNAEYDDSHLPFLPLPEPVDVEATIPLPTPMTYNPVFGA